MNQSFLEYLDRLELMVFFCGYPVLYAIVQFTGNFNTTGKFPINARLVKLLPYSYAFTGILYLGLVLKNMSPDISFDNLAHYFGGISLRLWALLSLLFWIPLFSRKPLFSLLHSLVFFYFLVADIIKAISSDTAADMVKNDMKIYFTSILINIVSFIVIALIFFICQRLRSKKERTV